MFGQSTMITHPNGILSDRVPFVVYCFRVYISWSFLAPADFRGQSAPRTAMLSRLLELQPRRGMIGATPEGCGMFCTLILVMCFLCNVSVSEAGRDYGFIKGHLLLWQLNPLNRLNRAWLINQAGVIGSKSNGPNIRCTCETPHSPTLTSPVTFPNKKRKVGVELKLHRSAVEALGLQAPADPERCCGSCRARYTLRAHV